MVLADEMCQISVSRRCENGEELGKSRTGNAGITEINRKLGLSL